jgi:hypothetical protein
MLPRLGVRGSTSAMPRPSPMALLKKSCPLNSTWQVAVIDKDGEVEKNSGNIKEAAASGHSSCPLRPLPLRRDQTSLYASTSFTTRPWMSVKL